MGKVYQAPTATAAAGGSVLAPKLMHNPFLEQDARVNAPVRRNFVVPPKKIQDENVNGNVQVGRPAQFYITYRVV